MICKSNNESRPGEIFPTRGYKTSLRFIQDERSGRTESEIEGLIKACVLLLLFADMHRTSPLRRSKKEKRKIPSSRVPVSRYLRVCAINIIYVTRPPRDAFLSLHTSFVISLQPIQIDSRFEREIDPVTLFSLFSSSLLICIVLSTSFRITLCREFVNRRDTVFLQLGKHPARDYPRLETYYLYANWARTFKRQLIVAFFFFFFFLFL